MIAAAAEKAELDAIKFVQTRSKGAPKLPQYAKKVIGLENNKTSRIPYEKKNAKGKKLILLYFLLQNPEDFKNISQGNLLITTEDFPVRVKTIPDNLTDDNVNLNILRNVFENEKAFKMLKVAIEEKKNELESLNTFYTCHSCNELIQTGEMVSCDGCLNWVHKNSHCSKKFRKNQKADWLCPVCTSLPF